MRRHRPYYIGLMLALGIGGVLVLLLVAISVPTVAQTPFPTVSPAPTITFTPLPTNMFTPTPAGCVAPMDLVNGSIVYIKPGVIIRHQPSRSGAPVNYFAEEWTQVVITGGPVCENDYNWWQIHSPGNDGWVAEGRPETGYFISNTGYNVDGSQALGCGAPEQFVVGEKLILFRGLRVRQNPGLQGLVLTVASEGAEAAVLEGPQCADGYNWWKVRLTVLDRVYDGWVVQGTRTTDEDWVVSQSVLAQEVCDHPLALNIGDAAYVNYYDGIPKRLRALPSLSAPILFDLIDNVPVIILDGPWCADGYNWWKVTVRSNIAATGWLAEGGRWIRVIDQE